MTAESEDAAAPGDGDTLPTAEGLAVRAREVMDLGWCDAGFTRPSATTYPWQWLWDSCFHAVVWAALGDDRAAVELASVFESQDPSGFVPHVAYRGDDIHDVFWGRTGTSCITQPPMFGHAAAELERRGLRVDDEVVAAAERGLLHLLAHRPRHESGLVRIVHPWESGADDSARWDHWCPGGFSREAWFRVKGELVASIEFDRGGAPTANHAFDPAPAGFNALVVFNALELATLTGTGRLRDLATELAGLLLEQWEPEVRTWVDAGPSLGSSGRVRTLDALLPVLVAPAETAQTVLAAVVDENEYGGPYGPAGVHRAEPSFEPDTYWRGPAWPQLTYLLWVAARRSEMQEVATHLAQGLISGARRSGFAEYWHPDTGEGLGARPQSWAALAVAVA
jgi:hypothetical protein